MGSLQNKGYGIIKYLDSFNYRSNILKGLLGQLRIMGFSPGDSMNKLL